MFPASVQAAPATTQSATSQPAVVTCSLTLAATILNPRENAVGAIGGSTLFIVPFELVDQKPDIVQKEPNYAGRPKYGAFKVGNGPKSVTYFAIDESKESEGKIYVDLNQNGDLTDDGNPDWDSITNKYKSWNFEKTVTVHASWGTPLVEKESGSYTLWIAKGGGSSNGGCIRMTGRTGSLVLRGKSYPIVVGESAGDGIFTVPADGDMTRPPVLLYVDTNNTAPFDPAAHNVNGASKRMPEKFNLAHPVKIDDHWYIARPSISGATLTVQETTAPGEPNPTPPAVVEDKLPLGSPAPDFTVQTPEGKPVSLSDFKGKLIILDLWATWCGPCQQSMPSLEKLYQRVKDQDVVVLSVNVLDEKQPFDGWMKQHANTDYHFNFAFDPSGRDKASIASSTYEVPAIPAWFLISRDGKIAAKDLGYAGNEDKLMSGLREQKVQIQPQ